MSPKAINMSAVSAPRAFSCQAIAFHKPTPTNEPVFKHSRVLERKGRAEMVLA